jgi:hypothetical protein
MEPRRLGTKLLVTFAVCAVIGLAITEGAAAKVYNLSVTKAGTGTGVVTSLQGGIYCGTVCTADFGKDDVTLVATAGAGSAFTGWSGDCSGTTTTCKVKMNKSKSVTATFLLATALPTLTLQKSGSGWVVANDVTYVDNAEISYIPGTRVTLSAEAGLGYVFSGWSGACTGSRGCTVTMSADRAVAATFVPADPGTAHYTLSIAKAGFGYGTVVSDPPGIDCGVMCSGSVTPNTVVTLVPNPETGSTFAGWSGACSGTGPCSISMSSNRSITAKFDGSSPGSVLFFPIYTSIDSQPQDTVIRVTNTHSTQDAMVHAFFALGQDGGVADTFFLASGGTFTFNASDWDPGSTGCIVLVAVDAYGNPTNFNYLTGQYDISFASGQGGNNLNAKAIRALRTVARDQNARSADLKFNGLDYEFLPNTLSANNLPSIADGNNTRIVVSRLGGDLGSNMAPLGDLAGILYSQTMTPYDWTATAAAPAVQTVQTLSSTFPATNPSYLDIVLAGQKGSATVWGMPQNTKGIFGVSLNYNANTHSTSAWNFDIIEQLTGEVTITMPVFMPD